MSAETMSANLSAKPNQRGRMGRIAHVSAVVAAVALTATLVACGNSASSQSNVNNHVEGIPQRTIQTGLMFHLDCDPKDPGPHAIVFENDTGAQRGGIPYSWYIQGTIKLAGGKVLNVYLGAYATKPNGPEDMPHNYYAASQNELNDKSYSSVSNNDQIGPNFRSDQSGDPGTSAIVTAGLNTDEYFTCNNASGQPNIYNVPPEEPTNPNAKPTKKPKPTDTFIKGDAPLQPGNVVSDWGDHAYDFNAYQKSQANQTVWADLARGIGAQSISGELHYAQ